MMRVSVLVVAGVMGLILGCSKNQSVNLKLAAPTVVNQPAATVDTAKDAKTILIANDETDRKKCEAEVRNSGGTILYRSEQGLILTDAAKGELKTPDVRCEGYGKSFRGDAGANGRSPLRPKLPHPVQTAPRILRPYRY